MRPSGKLAEWPEDGTERVPDCPLCGTSERKLLHAQLEDRIFFAAPGAWDMWSCQACGAAWLDPRPNEASIGLAYASYYTHETATAAPPATGLAALRVGLGNGYRNARYGSRLEPASRFGRLAAALFRPMRWQVDVFYRYLPATGGKSLRLLDIGCGNGAFLDAAKGANWQTCGVEPDPVARQHATYSGHDVRPDISDWTETAAFDAVTISHVIEHVHDPARYLAKAFALLRPGGHLFIDTPNVDAIGHEIYGRHWRGLEPPRHLILFNRTGLRKVLVEAGFTNIKFRPRIDALSFTARQSRRIADGVHPQSHEDVSSAQPWPSPWQQVRAVLGERSEFLTATAKRP